MPLTFRIDHRHRLVIAAAEGTLTDRDVFGYQHFVWSRPELAGYDELVDMTSVRRIDLPEGDRVRELAQISAQMDSPSQPSRFAILAPSEIAFGLGQVFQAYRSMMKDSTKEVAVFRTMDEVRSFLGIDDPLPMPDLDSDSTPP